MARGSRRGAAARSTEIGRRVEFLRVEPVHRKVEDHLGRVEGIDPPRPPGLLLEYPFEAPFSASTRSRMMAMAAG
jgi:hypothetical protein